MWFEIYILIAVAVILLFAEFVPIVCDRCGDAAEKFYDLLSRIKNCHARWRNTQALNAPMASDKEPKAS